ncbi:butyrophilin subfamily 2 member A2-like isoform X4 [Natator depressus]|uniref:butyrophilin subfamily 2 member A2-like isoform X4 n=1 Tax=Natator depressus TaxID=27790 RepID=UPI003EBAB84F
MFVKPFGKKNTAVAVHKLLLHGLILPGSLTETSSPYFCYAGLSFTRELDELYCNHFTMHIGIKVFSTVFSSTSFIFIMKWLWGDFTVTVHVDPPIALVGQAVMLSCNLIGHNPANVQVHWYKWERSKNTTLYFYNSTEKGTELGQAGDQHRIKGRYENGVVSMKLFPGQVEDSGQHVCAVTSDGVYQEAIAQVTVAGFGSAPRLTIDHQQNNSVTLRCTSQGWYPQPEVCWTDSTGQNITAMAETRIQKDLTDLYQIHSTLRVADIASDTISCTIRNPLLKRHRKKVIAISGFFDVEAEHDVVTAGIGENAILPCRLITKHLPPSMELQWRKVGPGKDKTIYFYLYDQSSPLVNSYPHDDKCAMGYLSPNGVNSREWRRKEYGKKAEVFKGKEFGKGNISLKLNNIQVEDEGKYVCSATANSFHRKIIIDILVIAQLKEEKEELQEPMGDLEKRRKELQEPMGDLEKRRKELQEPVGDLEKRLKELQEQMGDLEERKKELQEPVEELQEPMGVLIFLLLSIAGITILFLGKWNRDLEKRKKELQKQMEELQEQMGDLEKRKKEFQEQMGDLEKRIKESQEQMGDLEKRISEMKKELEWRRARNNSDDITLHGVTAHPNLSISEDKKSFTHEAQPQQVPPNPERFDSTICVLGCEGFSSGKHYWEVEVVSSTDWDLGVARTSIQRKGKLSLSPKEGFWALGLSGRDYWAKTDPWTRVMVQKKPKKIGVSFSYQDRQVTFFNVTDMSVLFTFNDCSFSGEVYPFFKNSDRKTTMRICSINEE